jgi:integrase
LSSLEPQEDLSLKVLTLKLTSLLALTSGARAHEIAALDCNHLSKKADSMEFIIPTHVKNSRPYHERFISTKDSFGTLPCGILHLCGEMLGALLTAHEWS